jgi:hypothetical protein
LLPEVDEPMALWFSKFFCIAKNLAQRKFITGNGIKGNAGTDFSTKV